uniref:Uncharacterized protein n=1 Tax=Physcomitrium patens TaxID=3218 RepID=A0A2K1IYN6_PHYPA|nr:hypothetical protein PHYPA_024206 [Physcomitrium patens]
MSMILAGNKLWNKYTADSTSDSTFLLLPRFVQLVSQSPSYLRFDYSHVHCAIHTYAKEERLVNGYLNCMELSRELCATTD